MLGNPCQSNWPDGFREYVIASLPQLCFLDGKEIERSDRIIANQNWRQRDKELKSHLGALRDANNLLEDPVSDVIGNDEAVPYTPESRRQMYLEMAEQKEEDRIRKSGNAPRRRDIQQEHTDTLDRTRKDEREALQRKKSDANEEIRQCNEGKWEFHLTDNAGQFIFELELPKFLDTSLIDIDVHPTFVSIIVKNKKFRLRFPEAVHSDGGKAERSKVTGTLRLTLPKTNANSNKSVYYKDNERKPPHARTQEDTHRIRRFNSSKCIGDEVNDFERLILYELM